MEMAFIEEAMVAEEPPEPMEEPPFPVLLELGEGEPWPEEFTKVGSPPPETSDIVRGVLPPRPRRMVLGQAETTSIAATPDPSAALNQPSDLAEWGTLDTAAPESPVAEGRLRLNQFNQQVDAAYDRVSVEFGTNRRLSASCFRELRTARDLVLRHDVAGLPQAEYHLQQVEVRLKRSEGSGAALREYGWRIVAWGLLWGAILLTTLSLLRLGWFDWYLAMAGTGQLPDVKLESLLSTMLWGGLGGVVAIWYSLFKHVHHRDFDPQYNLSYLGKPFFGLVLGGMLYVTVQILNLLLGIWPGPLLSGWGWATMPTFAPWVIYVLAWICGFQEDRLFDFLDRSIKRTFYEQPPKADLHNPPAVV
jgi:hypothetical protein